MFATNLRLAQDDNEKMNTKSNRACISREWNASNEQMENDAALSQGTLLQHPERCSPTTTLPNKSTVTKFWRYVSNACAAVGSKDAVFALLVFNWSFLWSNLFSCLRKDNVAYTLLVIPFTAIWWWYHASDSTARRKSDGSFQDFKHAPTIFECRTTHTRVSSTSHAFAYSYLLVGVPIGWHGSIGSVLSSNSLSDRTRPQKGWFSVNAEDYLLRGEHVDGLSGKLKEYLRSQHVSIDNYPFAYLVTAPRFCGFSFNPVSFWYLYDRHQILAAMILEVNNTFDERRMYFLQRDEKDYQAPVPRFRSRWDKDFHVSPFNDRDGIYSLSAADPFEQSSKNHIDNTIVLGHPDGTPKIVARVFSVCPPIDPSGLSTLQTYGLIGRWWWVGLVTNARILREARMLWLKKLPVFYRPEVKLSSIGRTESREEIILESFFRAFLRRITQETGVAIDYIPAAGPEGGKCVRLRKAPIDNGRAKKDVETLSPKHAQIEVKVTTPAFYAELAREPDVLKTLDRFCFKPTAGQAMAYTSDTDAFRKSLEAVLCTPNTAPKTIKTPLLEGTVNQPAIDIDTNVDARLYHRTCLVVFLADRFAFGSTWLLRLYIRVLRMTGVLMVTAQLSGIFHGSTDVFGVVRSIIVLGLELMAVYGLGTLLI